MMMTVFLSHGLESGPGALKIQALKGVAEHVDDCEPVVMDYRGMSEPASTGRKHAPGVCRVSSASG